MIMVMIVVMVMVCESEMMRWQDGKEKNENLGHTDMHREHG